MADLVQKKLEAVATTAYGKTLDAPVKYEYSWTEYPDFATLQAANDVLTNDEQVKVRNTERKAAARQKQLTVTLDALGIVKPTIENDEQLRLREMFKVLMASKIYTEDAAREMAAKTLNLTWADAE